MDTLALLCTLHADGPASLKRLRAEELNSIDDVLGCSVETTAEVLGLSMAQARRFHREARTLAMRVHTEGLDREERMYPGSAPSESPVAQPKGAGGTEAAPAVTATQPQTTSASGGEMEKTDIAAILAPVMERWDEEEAAAEGAASAPAPAPATSEPSAEDTSDVLEGVDPKLRDALRAAGYATLTSLVEVEPLVLSRATGRTYSEACRVNFLAKRALEGGGGVAAAPTQPTAPVEEPAQEADELADAMRVLKQLTETAESADERFSPAPPESSLPQDPHAEGGDQEGAGGPFA